MVKDDDKGKAASGHMPIRNYMYVCAFVVKRSTLIVTCTYHLTISASGLSVTRYTIVEEQLPFLTPAMGSPSVSVF